MRSRAVLLACIVVGVLFSQPCCVALPAPAVPFTAEHQVEVVAAVDEVCVLLGPGGMATYNEWVGTAVMVAPDRALTAGHLSTCRVQGLHVTMPDGSEGPAGVEWLNRNRDLALLTLPEGGLGERFAAAPTIGTSYVGEEACARTAEPKREQVCGVVTAVGGAPDGDVTFTAPIQHGNSGSAVYDRRGRLLGIVTSITPSGGGRYVSVTEQDLR
jgi:hypothetical protein